MPEVHFIGTIEKGDGLSCDMISVTWSIIPGMLMRCYEVKYLGNQDWYLQKGNENIS